MKYRVVIPEGRVEFASLHIVPWVVIYPKGEYTRLAPGSTLDATWHRQHEGARAQLTRPRLDPIQGSQPRLSLGLFQTLPADLHAKAVLVAGGRARMTQAARWTREIEAWLAENEYHPEREEAHA